MSNWLTVSIWIIFVLWSIIEIAGMYTFVTRPYVRYTVGSSIVTWLWLMFTVFWLCFQFIG